MGCLVRLVELPVGRRPAVQPAYVLGFSDLELKFLGVEFAVPGVWRAPDQGKDGPQTAGV